MEVKEIETDRIKLSSQNTRKMLEAGQEDASLEDLALNIKEKGLLQPITLRRVGAEFEVIAGQRRLNACKRLGWRRVPAIVRENVNDAEATAISLIENVHRADMHPMDKARAYRELSRHYRHDLDRVSRETRVGTPTIKKYLALLELPPEIREHLSTAEGPAKIEALSTLTRTFSSPKDMADAYRQISGFSQPIQKEILKRTDGDVSRIPDLVEQAMEGAFSTRTCRGLHGKLMCEFIPAEIADHVVELVQIYRSGDEQSLKGVLRSMRNAAPTETPRQKNARNPKVSTAARKSRSSKGRKNSARKRPRR